MARWILTLPVLLLAVTMCQAEIFTALATMKRALYIEKRLADQLRSYVPLIPDTETSAKVAQ